MITTDIKKKELVEQLIRDGKISLDEGLILLEDNSNNGFIDLTPVLPIYPNIQPITYPWTDPYPYTQPWYLQDSGGITIIADDDNVKLFNGDYPGTCTVIANNAIPFTYTC